MTSLSLLKRVVVVLVILPMAGCGPVFFVEGDLPSVCKTMPDMVFQGVPVAGGAAITLPAQALDFGSAFDVLKNKRFTGELRILNAEMSTKTGDLGFLDHISVAVVSTDAAALPFEVIEYTRDPSAPSAPTTIQFANPDQPNLFPYLIAGPLNFSVTVAGNLPTINWVADLKVCVSAKAKFQYL